MSSDNGTTNAPQPEPQPEPKPEGTLVPKKGGFGAFSQQYRDRWAAEHPDAKPSTPRKPDAPATDVSPPDTGTER